MYDNGGQFGHGVGESVFGVVCDLVGVGEGRCRFDIEFGVGAQSLSDPPHPHTPHISHSGRGDWPRIAVVRSILGHRRPLKARRLGSDGRRAVDRDGGGVSSRAVTLPHDQVSVGPPVVLRHARVADRSMRSDVLPLRGFRAIIPDLPEFDFQVLVAAGEDGLPDFRAGSFAASLGAPLELILGVGHRAPMEDPAAFRSRLLRFLA